MKYPEKIPSDSSSDSFNFSFSQVTSTKSSIESDLFKVNERISRIVDSEKFHVNDFPVLKHILALNPSRNDLKKLSKACDRLSDLVSVLSDLSSKLAVVDLAAKNPNWFTLAFGDFQKEIDNDIDSLFNDD